VVAKSQKCPVIVGFGSTRAPQAQQMDAVIETIIAEYNGSIAFAKVAAESNMQLVQAFQVQTVPSYFLVLSGQVQPLFQGVVQETQVRQVFEQIAKIAAEAGLTVGEAEKTEPPLDPRYQRAFDAIENGDWDTARAAYEEALAANPADADAKAGLAQVAFLSRATVLDIDAVLALSPSTTQEILDQADAHMLMGDMTKAFTLLINAVRDNIEEREVFKDRLLEYFTVMGDVPEVRDARRALTNALF
jgi:putative thioredoxin